MIHELPEQWTVGCGTLNGQKVCRVDDVRAYGAACYVAALEEAALICEKEAERFRSQWRYGRSSITSRADTCATAIHAAIGAGTKGPQA
jgi:hypothetical protein